MKYILTLLGAFFAINAQAQFASQQGSVLNLNYNLQNSVPQAFSLTFKNTGSTVASLPAATGSGVGVFKIALNRCVNVSPNKSCQISYAPPRNIALGTYVFILSGIEVNYQVVNQDANGPIVIAPVESLEITPATLAPLQFVLGEKKKTVNLSVKNTGTVPVQPIIGWSSNNAGIKFSVNRCLSSLAPNKTCTMSLAISSPADGQEFSQDLQAYVGASLKDSLSLIVKGPSVSNPSNLFFSSMANQVQYRISSNSNALVDVSSGTLLGEEELYLPPGDYRIYFNASVQNDTNHLIQPTMDYYSPASTYNNTFNCYPLINDARAWSLPSYYCDLNITASNAFRIPLDSYIIVNPLFVACTDPQANNQNSSANFNDESLCSYNYGCMDPGAINYDSMATRDNGSCMYNVSGCMDSIAENYNSMATIDDGSCYYRQGCMNSNALNYDPMAVQENGSCQFNTAYDWIFSNLFINPLNIEGDVTATVITPHGEGGQAFYSSSYSSKDNLFILGDVFEFAAPTNLQCNSAGTDGSGSIYSFDNPVTFNFVLNRWESVIDQSIYLSQSNQLVNISCIISGYQFN